MRTKRTLRAPGAINLAAGAVIIALPASALALSAGPEAAAANEPDAVYAIAPGGAGLAPSPSQRVAGGSRLTLKPGDYSAVTGQSVTVRGELLPGAAGRVVRLMARTGSAWTAVAQSRTGSAGGFDLKYIVATAGSRALRVSFGGVRGSRSVSAPAGELIGMVYRVASWYYDAGHTACGFHATDGVANKTLPCGTKVTLAYDGRSVVATVDDRGPYVGGRDYDLNQNTAHALGMGGVATVESSI